jgi:hypothetical protein
LIDSQYIKFSSYHYSYLFREIIEGGKMAVLDCSPSALKILYNSNEFMPYVVFMAAPGLDEMRHIYENGKMAGAIMASQRTLNNFEKTSSIRRLGVPPLFSSSCLEHHRGFLPVLRIRDVYPGSELFHSRSLIRIFSIPDSGSARKNSSILTPKNGF